MMRFHVFLGIVLASLQAAGSSVILPADNSKAQFREDSGRFFAVWQGGNLLDGSAARAERQTDTGLNHEDSLTSGFNDYLYPFAWENEFAGSELLSKCRAWWWLSYVVGFLYVMALWWGTDYVKDKKPFDLKGPLALWNLLLAVFSFIGAARMVPHLVLMLSSYGFDYSICRTLSRSFGNGPPGLWLSLFIFSKYFELIDTAFLVVRKKKVGCLHWYHHCTVLLYCWHSYLWEMPTGVYVAAMNYTVHMIMYFYYFLAAVCKPPSWALFVTCIQLIQMAIGIGITISHMSSLTSKTVANCDGHFPNLVVALGMYASYFMLFAQFFVERFCKRGKNAGNKLKKAD